MKKPDPSLGPKPARLADEAGSRRDDDARLYPPWNDDVVCRSERARRPCHRACMQRHRHQEFLRFLNRLERDIPAGKLVHVILDNYGSHKHPKSERGWRVIRAGSSTSPQPRHPGSTRSKASSPNSPGAACSVARSLPLSSSRPRSIAISPITTPAQSHSSGLPIPIPSLLLRAEGTKR
jgi:hypothetical protein